MTLAEIIVTGGTATMLSGAGASYEVSLTLSGQGDVTVSIPADVAQTALGAWNLASGVLRSEGRLLYGHTRNELSIDNGATVSSFATERWLGSVRLAGAAP